MQMPVETSLMRWMFAGLIVLHGLIHVAGFAKAFGLAELPQLTQPISRSVGVVWLAAALGLVVTALLLIGQARVWWMAGLAVALLSQGVIIASWSDARFGTIANALLLTGVAYGFASQGPLSFRAEYRREVRARLSNMPAMPVLTEADLGPLPEPVRRYLRVTGAVGQPRVHHIRVSWRGRIRQSPDDPWMPFVAEQYSFPAEPSRFFLMDATRSGLPVDVFHAFRGQSATMRVRLLSLVRMVDASGPELTRAETVTLLNDLCLLAPAALIDPGIAWEPLDSRSVRARYTVGPNTVGAVLSFNEAGELVDFVSDDRLAASPDGERFIRQRWSTPVHDYRGFGPLRLMARGEGRWHPPDGEFAYLEIELLDVDTNPGS
jgi:hypothetical protein